MRDPYDYSLYSLEELRDAQAHVDRELYPERAAQIDGWVRQRSAERAAEEARRVPFPAPSVTTNRGAPFLAACGLTTLFVVAILTFIVVLLLVRARGEGDASKRAALRIASSVARNWNEAELRNSASEAFESIASSPDMERAFRMFRQLGPMASLGEPVGRATAVAGIGAAQSAITAEYSIPAKFANGDATIRITLVRERGQWRTTGFFVISDTFLPK